MRIIINNYFCEGLLSSLMELTRTNYKENISKDVMALAGKCKVRECDEIENNAFQAYVDEKKESFDVLLRINDDLIQAHTCDCDSKYEFCQHKTALLVYLVKEHKPRSSKKKADPIDALLVDVDAAKLKIWLKEILTKHKDLSISFLQHFSPENIRYTPEDVKKITQDAVKAVLNTRKKADVSEIKKITDLWKQVHAPVLTQVYQHLPDLTNFLNFHHIIISIEEIQQKLKTTGTRINKYIETLLADACDHLVKIADDAAWLTVTGYFAERIMETPFSIRVTYLSFQTNHYAKLSPDRKALLIPKLFEYYAAIGANQVYDADKFTQTMFDMVVDAGLFNKYYKLFKPIRFNNEYNFELISSLVATGYLSLAESYCIEQIKGNFKEEFNLMYREFLVEIYTVQENDDKLAGVLKDLFPLTYSMKDFQFVYTRITNEAEKKNWRGQMLARARQAAPHNPLAAMFCFQLMEVEQNYKKMIDYIEDGTPYAIIAAYAEKMVLIDKFAFLKAVVSKQDNFFEPDEPLLEDSLAAISKAMHTHYSAPELTLLTSDINRKLPWSYRPNLFTQYISAINRK